MDVQSLIKHITEQFLQYKYARDNAKTVTKKRYYKNKMEKLHKELMQLNGHKR